MAGTVQIIDSPDNGTETVFYPMEVVADILHRSPRTIRRYVRAGKLTTKTVCGLTCISADQVAAYIAHAEGNRHG